MPADSAGTRKRRFNGCVLRMSDAARNDWVVSRKRLIAWDIPMIAIVVAAFLGGTVQTVTWTVALAWMGVACLLNARRCGRRHCYLTGPFFVLMGALSFIHGSGSISFGNNGWWWLGATLVLGGYGLLWKLPEYLWGTYVEQTAPRSDPR